MANLISALGLEREFIADKLAAPLAKLLSDAGTPVTTDSLRASLLDKNTVIDFPNFTITRMADVVVTEVVVTEVVVVSAEERPRLVMRRDIRKPAPK
jgi:hypothetical protein